MSLIIDFRVFLVKVKHEVVEEGFELVKYYKLQASSRQSAEVIVNSYLQYRFTGDNKFYNEGVNRIMLVESEEQFEYKNWEIAWPARDTANPPYVEYVTEIEGE